MIYVVVMPGINEAPIELPAEGVLWWVRGVADCLRERHLIDDVIDDKAPIHAQRMQALQIGNERNWFSYRYVKRES